MIGYVTLGSNDLERATAFYDALLEIIDAKRTFTNERFRTWATAAGNGVLAICTPHDQKAATVGNGVMVALNVGSREAVDRVYAKALELGGTDEGAAGLRGDNFYGGYFRDPDGNKLVAFVIG